MIGPRGVRVGWVGHGLLPGHEHEDPLLYAREPPRARPDAMEGGGFADHSHATPSLPVGRARADPSRAFISVGQARCPLTRRNLLSARNRPAMHHRRRISPSRQRVTRAVTRRVTESADSIGLVVPASAATPPPGPAGPPSASPLVLPGGSKPHPR